MQKNIFDDPFYFFNKERYDQRRRRYALGIFFIVLVSAIWVGSSVLSQFLYTERSFDSPFLVTYIGITLFTFILPFKYMSDKIGFTHDTTCLSYTTNNNNGSTSNGGGGGNGGGSTRTGGHHHGGGGGICIDDDLSVVTEYEEMMHQKAIERRKQRKIAKKQKELIRRKKIVQALASNPNTTTTLSPTTNHDVISGGIVTASNKTALLDSSSNVGGDGFVAGSISTTGGEGGVDIMQPPAMDDDAMTVSSQYSASVSTAFDLNHPGRHWNHMKHIFVAIHIAPVLFIANWLFNASLQATSVVSATVLVSTSGMFVFFLAVLVKEEKFHYFKLVGAVLGIVGSVLTARHDFNVQDDYDPYNETDQYNCTTENCDYNLWGDTLALLAAVAFGAYAVQVRLLCPVDEEIYSMGLLLGYIGLFITVPLLPVAVILMTKITITWEIFLLIAIRGLLDYVISEYLHFRAVVLTNATIATVGLGLTIPMAFIADYLIRRDNIASMQSLLGALAVTAGFILVNIVDDDDDNECHHHGHGHHGQASSGTTSATHHANGIPTSIGQDDNYQLQPPPTTESTSSNYKSKVVV